MSIATDTAASIGRKDARHVFLEALAPFGPAGHRDRDGLLRLRDLARNATGELSKELGTDISLEDLHPKTLIRKHLLSPRQNKALLQRARKQQRAKQLNPRRRRLNPN